MSKYWVVDASWNSDKENKDILLSRGYWYLCSDEKIVGLLNNSQEETIEVGDRIAIRTESKDRAPKINLKAIGIVKSVDYENHKISIEWVLEEVKRMNYGQGQIKKFNGPFNEKEKWLSLITESL